MKNQSRTWQLLVVVATTIATLINGAVIVQAQEEDKAEEYFIYPSQKALFSGQGGEDADAAATTTPPQQNGSASEMPDITTMSAEQWRQFAEQGIQSLSRSADKPKMVSVKDFFIHGLEGNDIRLRLYDPGVDRKPSPVIVYMFGGGWTVGNVDVFDDSIRRIANSSGLMVAAMDYRLAPEHPFPAGLNDVVATVRWISEHGEEIGIDPNRIALGGHSAGANLALSTALILRDSDNPSDKDLIKTLFLIAGQYSPDILNSESMRMFGQGQFGASVEDAKMALNWTFHNASDYSNPLAFPLLADNLTGLPPVYIAAMALDPLKDDSIKLADRLREAGQEHYLAVWPGVAHSAIVMIPITPEIQAYLDSMTVYLKGILEPTN
jgi:acetyl esterase